MNEKIDVVILWVDGNDSKWLEKKKVYANKLGIMENNPERFRDWNNLHYIFRGIEKFASWVNHIYLVTDEQKPKWLNDSCRDVTVVNHSEIIPSKYLPTFNSQAIELCLHKINGLSENFLYFNDDIFIIDFLNKEDFFIDGKPRMSASLNVIMPMKDNLISQVNFNNTAIINSTFDKKSTLKNNITNWINFKYGIENIRTILNIIWPKFTGFKQTHSVGVFNKSTFEEVWELYETELLRTLNSKFRMFDNNNQWLISDWQLASNNFIPQKFGFSKDFHLSSYNDIEKCSSHIKYQKTKIVCVNDTEFLQDFENAKKKINRELSNILPTKSRYEK